MIDYARYAIYWAPPAGSALWRFGSEWLGWDAEAGAPVPHPPLREAEAAALPGPLEELTASPRRYGFHATLKPPFALTADQEPSALAEAARALAAGVAPFEAPPLRLVVGQRFASLRFSAPCPAMDALAAACVRDLDAFRAPASQEELARRRAAGLSPSQEANLSAWVYPYVMDDFEFHLTLSGALSAAALEGLAQSLVPRVIPLCTEPVPVREVSLYGDPGGGAPFRLIARLPLGG